MARTKKISENMGDVIHALAEFRLNEATIRAEYARKAEQKIIESRDELLDLMFIRHNGAGPSEIANTTGLSRSTVVRWREEWRARQAALPEEQRFSSQAGIDKADMPEFVERVRQLVEPQASDSPSFKFSLAHSVESNEKVHVIVNEATGQKVYVIWGDIFTSGAGVDNSPEIERPEWLTDDVLLEAESATGMDIPGAIHR